MVCDRPSLFSIYRVYLCHTFGLQSCDDFLGQCQTFAMASRMSHALPLLDREGQHCFDGTASDGSSRVQRS